MNKLRLLKAIYEAIQWDKLYGLLPQVSRQQVDEFFQELREKFGAEAEAPEELRASPPEGRRARVRGGEAYVYCDGASKGNPGPSGIGMVLTTPEGEEVLAWGASIGRATNNVAEYRAVIEGLKKALELEVRSVRVLCDSELVVRQIQGGYKVKSPGLKPLHAETAALLSRFDKGEIQYIPRDQNLKADALAIQHAKMAKKQSRES